MDFTGLPLRLDAWPIAIGRRTRSWRVPVMDQDGTEPVHQSSRMRLAERLLQLGARRQAEPLLL